jgi:hypothetical protein
MKLEEIPVGKVGKKNIKFKKEVILRNIGKQVILYDSYNCLVHGLLKGSHSHDYYRIHIADGRENTLLRYDKLEKLFLLKAHFDNPLPEIKTK